MKTYRTDQRILYVSFVLMGMSFILAILPPVDDRSLLGAIYFASLALGIGLLATKLSYARLNNNTHFEFRDFLVLHYQTNPANISAISYAPTWRLQTALRSVFIFYDGKWAKRMELKNSMFKEETLAQIIQDLKRANPSIYLDEHAEALMKKYESERQ